MANPGKETENTKSEADPFAEENKLFQCALSDLARGLTGYCCNLNKELQEDQTVTMFVFYLVSAERCLRFLSQFCAVRKYEHLRQGCEQFFACVRQARIGSLLLHHIDVEAEKLGLLIGRQQNLLQSHAVTAQGQALRSAVDCAVRTLASVRMHIPKLEANWALRELGQVERIFAVYSLRHAGCELDKDCLMRAGSYCFQRLKVDLHNGPPCQCRFLASFKPSTGPVAV